MQNGQKWTIKNGVSPVGSSHITGVIVSTRLGAEMFSGKLLVTLEFWNLEHTGTIQAEYPEDQIEFATWRERLESSRNNVQDMFSNLEDELRETFVIPNSMIDDPTLHEHRANDGQTIAELERRRAGGKASQAKLSEKEDREQRVQLYASQIEAGQEIAYRPFVQRVVDDLNPALADAFGISLDNVSDDGAYQEQTENDTVFA